MFQRVLIASFLTLFIGLISVSGAVEAPFPLLVCPKTSEPPVVDGKLEESIWQQASQVTNFVLTYSSGASLLAEEQTKAYVLYDDEYLYLGFHCTEAHMDQLWATIAERDGEVWRYDSIEIFLNPMIVSDEYFHLIVNTKEVQYEGIGSGGGYGGSWDGQWRAKASIGDDYWQMEIAVPFAEIDFQPTEGAVLRANLNRTNAHLKEYGGWAFTPGGFHWPSYFGSLVMSDRAIHAGEIVSLGDAYGDLGGQTAISFTISNPSSSARVFKCFSDLVDEDGKTTRQKGGVEVELPGLGTKQIKLPYEVREVGRQKIMYSVYDPVTDELWYRSAVYTLQKRHLKPRLLQAQKLTTEAQARLQTLPAEASGKAELCARLAGIDKKRADLLTELVRKVPPSQTRYEKLAEATKRVSEEAQEAERQTRALAMRSEAGRQADFDGLVFVMPAMTDDVLFPTTLPDTKYLADEISLFASPGEYEPATFSIYALGDLQAVKVEAGILTGDNGRIPAEAVDIRVVKCWYQGGAPGWRGDVKYMNPELLLKDDDFIRLDTEKQINLLKAPDAPRDADTLQPVNITINTLKQFWLTVHIPNDAAAGTYKGLIRIESADGQSAQVTLTLEVLPIRLAKPVLEYMVYYGPNRLDPGGRKKTAKARTSESEPWGYTRAYWLHRSEEQSRAELRNLKAHGITQPMIVQDPIRKPDGRYDFSALERAMELIQEEGFGEIPMFYFSFKEQRVGGQKTPEEIEQMEVWVKQVVGLAEKHGFTDAYFYGLDEAQGEALKAERLVWEMVHSLGGKIWVAAYTGFFPLVGDLLDLDIYGTAPVVPDITDKMREMGNKMYSMRNAPVQTLSRPLTTRCNYGLGNWLAGFDGSCSFAYQTAGKNIWDDSDTHNWDYVYAYPTVDGVLDTLEWEGWREAVDDIRYLTTLLEAIEQAKAKGGEQKKLAEQADRWVKELRSDVDAKTFYANSANIYKIDPRINFAGRDMQDIRREMAEWIIQLQGENNVVPSE